MQSPFSILTRVLAGHDLLMSNAVSGTGTLLKRSTGAPPTTKTITTSSVASPTLITTSAAHGLLTGDLVQIAGHTGSTPPIDGYYRVTVTTTTAFTIPVAVTVAGTGGTVQPPPPMETIAELTNVGMPGFSRDKLPSTNHNEGVESNVLGILNQDDIPVEVNYVGSEVTHQHLYADMITTPSPKKTWAIVPPMINGIGFQGDARLQQFKLAAAAVNSIQKASMALTWAGPVQQYLG